MSTTIALGRAGAERIRHPRCCIPYHTIRQSCLQPAGIPQWCDIYRWTEHPARTLSKVWRIGRTKIPQPPERSSRGGAESTAGKNEGREEFVIRRPGVKCVLFLRGGDEAQLRDYQYQP